MSWLLCVAALSRVALWPSTLDPGARLLLVVWAFALLAGAQAGAEAMPPELQPLAAEMAHEVFRFWRDHGPDAEHGGFHGTLDRRWAWGRLGRGSGLSVAGSRAPGHAR